MKKAVLTYVTKYGFEYVLSANSVLVDVSTRLYVDSK